MVHGLNEELLLEALQLQTFHTGDGREIRIHHQDAGELVVPTGKIVACDPYVLLDKHELARPVTPGKYRVHLFVAEYEDDKRTAFAVLRFSDQQVSHWELALRSGHETLEVKDSEFVGYAVDAGSGCFMDLATANLLESKFREDENYWQRLSAKQDDTYTYTWSWLNYAVNESGLNVIAFSSGYGDGIYGCYWGISQGGDAVLLVTDFGVLDSLIELGSSNPPE